MLEETAQSRHLSSAPRRAEASRRRVNLLISTINDTVARTWFAKAKQKALAATDQAEQHTIYRSANSWFNQANSVFAAKALDC